MTSVASARVAPPAADAAPGTPPGVERMSWPSRLYLGAVVGAAAVLSVVLAPNADLFGRELTPFALLAVAAAVAQLFVVRKPGFQALKPSLLFVLAAALVLPAELLPLFTVAQYLPEWLKTRPLPKVAGFNVANGILDALAASAVYHGLAGRETFAVSGDARPAVAGLVACVVYIAVNHALLAGIISLTSRSRLRATGLFDTEHLLTDLVICGLGVGVAALAVENAWTTPFLILPLVLIRRALAVPQLQAEARVDAKTGLYNARYFTEILASEFARAERFNRPLALLMADLDLLREINNSYGHLAGDAVLRAVATTFRAELRHYDVPARFGGEEFSILLPETTAQEALVIAERVRRAVAERGVEVDTVPEPLRATISVGVASFPGDGDSANDLVHRADLALYRAKLQGRNRVCAASEETLLLAPAHELVGDAPRLHVVPGGREAEGDVALLPPPDPVTPEVERRRPEKQELPRLRLLRLPRRLGGLVAAVSVAGIVGGLAGFFFGGHGGDLTALAAVVVLAGLGQALSIEFTDVSGSISVGVVGSLAGAALFDYRAALPLALASALVDWGARRTALHHVLFNIGALTLASLGAAGAFNAGTALGGSTALVFALSGIAAGFVYFAVNMALLATASSLETEESVWEVYRERCAWLMPHYVVYGFIGGMVAVVYNAVGLYAFAVFAVPLLLMRKSQESYLAHTRRSSEKLHDAAVTIQAQNVSLEQANRLLRERSTAAMESLSATVDARDAYTAGHSRRVQRLALAIGRELQLTQVELEVLGRAALFHDIGKLAVPDAVLLKADSLTEDEWHLIRRHADEGARIIERLGFLQDAVPSIRHHHEHWDGSGYPAGLVEEEIPLGARIIHVADALDSMVTTRIYRAPRPLSEALAEIRRGSGTQFCPRCVGALERLLPLDQPIEELQVVAS